MSNGERTPLLQTSPSSLTEEQRQKKSYKRTYHLYGASLSILFLFAFFTHWYRTYLPTPLSDAQARKADDFPGSHAYNEYLSQFTAPHSANTRENGMMRDWLASTIYGFQQEAIERHVEMDVIGYDDSIETIDLDWFSPNEKWYVESRNIIARINGTSGHSDAVMVNAHYDSVPTSNGVTDDGMGVVTVLELMRYFIQHPPRQTIIFLINNFEEGGLVGARVFKQHPWYPHIKLFLNLEGSGAGGRAIIFRSSNFNAVQKFAHSKAKLKHGSALGNDIFKYQLIKSDTDYSIFTRDGIPGVDLAFYTPRSYYHTARDDLTHTTPESLQYMGQATLHALKEIANSDDLLATTNDQEDFVYYDILGRVMLIYSFTTYQIINVLALVLIPAVALFLTPRNMIKARISLTLQGFVSVVSALFFAIVFIAAAAVIICKINPSMSYGDIYGAALYTFSAGFLGLQVSQWVLPSKLSNNLVHTDAPWYGLMAFWWLIVTASFATGTIKIASLYFAVYLFAFTSLALLAHTLIPKDQKLRSALIYFIQITVPAVLLFEIEFLVMDSLRHATADGTPEAAVYLLLAFPLVLILLHLVPWVHVAGNNRKATTLAAVSFVFLLSVCSALQPFNGQWSPNKIFFRQEYNAGDAFATVTVSTATGLQATLKKTLPPHEYDTLSCEPFKTHLTRCSYRTELVPKYASNETLQEFVMSEVEKVCDGTTCTASGSFRSKNSLMCRVMFRSALNGGKGVERATLQYRPMEGHNITALMSYVDKYDQEIEFSFEYDKADPPTTEVGCFYDEWTKLELPAFTALHGNLPEDSILLIRGQGLTYVNYYNLTL